jgi:hypothetical protein
MDQRAQEPIADTIPVGGNRDLQNTVLALEVRLGKIGYVVFQGPTKILDWGVRWLETQNGPLRLAVSSRVEALLKIYHPLAVVARNRTFYSAAANSRFATIVSAIRAETSRHSATFKILGKREVRWHFALRGYVTKHEIATSLSGYFEELSWKLPARRKPYESEAHAMVVFDAAANGLAFYGRRARQDGRTRPPA